MRLQFQQWQCTVCFSRYQNGRLRIDLTSATDGTPIATATVNVPTVALADDQVAIKDYGENAGLLDALVQANVVVDTGGWVSTGYTELAVCRLTDTTKAILASKVA